MVLLIRVVVLHSVNSMAKAVDAVPDVVVNFWDRLRMIVDFVSILDYVISIEI